MFPTLADVCGLPAPAGLDGDSLRPQLADPAVPGSKPARGYWTNGQRSVRTDRWRLIVQPGKVEGQHRIELFDYQTDPAETRNHAADHPEITRELLEKLVLVP